MLRVCSEHACSVGAAAAAACKACKAPRAAWLAVQRTNAAAERYPCSQIAAVQIKAVHSLGTWLFCLTGTPSREAHEVVLAGPNYDRICRGRVCCACCGGACALREGSSPCMRAPGCFGRSRVLPGWHCHLRCTSLQRCRIPSWAPRRLLARAHTVPLSSPAAGPRCRPGVRC